MMMMSVFLVFEEICINCIGTAVAVALRREKDNNPTAHTSAACTFVCQATPRSLFCAFTRFSVKPSAVMNNDGRGG